MIKDIKFAMLTVSTDEGHLHSHPMTTQQTEFDGDVWFIGSKKSQQVACMRARPQVNVSYSNPGKGLYVSMNGTAALVEDAGFAVVETDGIGVVSELVPESAVEGAAAWADLLALETALGRDAAFRALAAHVHVFARLATQDRLVGL